MSYEEFLSWIDYRNLRGSLNIGRRIECSTALIVHDARFSAGRKSEMDDLMPHEDHEYAEPEEIAALFGARLKSG